jgi:hypothetical protein
VDSRNELPPNLVNRVRRVELAFGGAVAFLIFLTMVGYMMGVVGAEPDTADLDELEFRPLVADFQGKVEYRAKSESSWRPLRWSDAFAQGDRVRTSSSATCDILLTWGTGFRIAPETEMTWSRLTCDGRMADVELYLSRGRVLAELEGLPGGSRFVVVTRYSRTKVKGTVLGVSSEDGKSKTTVLQGLVEVIDVSDPSNMVEVGAGRTVDANSNGPGAVQDLAAEERARLFVEAMEVKDRLARLSPSETTELGKGSVAFSAGAETLRGSILEEETDAPESADGERRNSGADRKAVRDVILAGLTYLNDGRSARALSLCTSTFKSVVLGSRAEKAGALSQFDRKRGDQLATSSMQRIRQTIRLQLRVVRLSVTVDGDVAYGEATVEATASPQGSSKLATRNYACSVRLLRQGGRWLIDLAIANEN